MNSEQKWDLVQYRFSSAKKTLSEVDILIQNDLWNVAVSRLYYACFYAVSALLVYNDLQAKTHNGTRQMFGLHFVDKGIIPAKTGRFYTTIFGMRHKGDYEDYFDYGQDDVLKLVTPAKELISQIQEILFKQ